MSQPVALVTGAGRGIGAATVAALVADGWWVAAVDRCAPHPAVEYPMASAAELGVTGAARKHGIPVTTVSQWQTGRRRAARNETAPSGVVSAVSSATNDYEDVAVAKADRPGLDGASATAADAVEATAITHVPTVGKKVVKRYTPSQKAQAIEHARRQGVSEASKTLGMSRFTIYEWLRKAEAAAKGEGEVISQQ